MSRLTYKDGDTKMPNFRLDAGTHATPTKKDATETCRAIIALVRNAVDNHDWSTELKLDDIVKRESKAPSGVPPITAEARVCEFILRGAIQADAPFRCFIGCRVDLMIAAAVGAQYQENVLAAFPTDSGAAWALAALTRSKDFLWDGKDRGPVDVIDVLYK